MKSVSAADGIAAPHGTPARVLVVLDRPVLVELIALTLNHGVCSVRTATTVENIATIGARWQPDVVIFDMAPNGIGTMHEIRNGAVAGSMPFMMGLVGRGDLSGTLAAVYNGADDILTVPFAPEELLARVIALTRQSRRAPIALTPAITVGELEIDIVNRTVRAGDVHVRLTPLEFGLLYVLAANPSRVFTREEILHALLGPDHQAEGKIVDQYVRSLRARLQMDGRHAGDIATVGGHGYRFSLRAKPSDRAQRLGAQVTW